MTPFYCRKIVGNTLFVSVLLSEKSEKMAQVKAVIVPAKALADGKHKIRISISHNSKTRYIPTNIIINSEREFRNGAITRRPDAAYLNVQLRKLLDKYQEAVDNIGYIDGLTCSEVVQLIKSNGTDEHKTIRQLLDEYLAASTISDNSVRIYKGKVNSFEAFAGGDILLEQLSYCKIIAYDKWLRTRGCTPVTVLNNVAAMRMLYMFAKRCGYALPKANPFAAYKFPQNSVREAWLTIEQIKEIRDYDAGRQAYARDMFMLSYYLGGINSVDLSKIDFRHVGNTLSYVRQKTASRTGTAVEFDLPDEVWPIVSRWADRCGHVFIGPKSGKLMNLSHTMKIISRDLKMPNLIFYSARKSFSQHAFELGISTSVIDYILGHSHSGGRQSLYHYIRVTPQQATAAVRAVLDNLK